MNQVSNQNQNGEFQNKRWNGIKAPGAIHALNLLAQHLRAKKGTDQAFIPSSSETEYTTSVVLAKDNHTGKPCLWECGGSEGRYGGGMIVAGPTGAPLTPIFSYLASSEHTNERHSLIPVAQDHLLSLAAFDEGDALVLVFKCLEVKFDAERGVPVGIFSLVEAYEGNPATVAPVYSRKLESELTESPAYRQMVSAAFSKAYDYQGRHALYTLPWRMWKSFVRPIEGQKPKTWEVQPGTSDKIVNVLVNTGVGDPDPRSVYEDYSSMMRDVETVVKSHLQRVSGGSGKGPRMYVLLYITEDGDQYRMTVHIYAMGLKIRDGEGFVKGREPALVKTFVHRCSSGDDKVFYPNTNRPLAWKNVTQALEEAGPNGQYRIVYEYMGT